MMDNLYLDKLKGKISNEQYDKFYESFTLQKNDINSRLGNLQEAEDIANQVNVDTNKTL